MTQESKPVHDPELRKMYPDDFDRVLPLLEQHAPSLGQQAWRRIFDYEWARDEDYCGYGLTVHGTVVGFLGLIFSERRAGSRVERYCNLTTWVVEEEYRGHSLSLLAPLRELRDHTLTDLSPTDAVAAISRRFGFSQLESTLTVCGPTLLRAIARRRPVVDLTSSVAELAHELGEDTRRIYEDHLAYPHCQHIVARSDDGPCYALFTTVADRDRFSYAHLHYVSDASVSGLLSDQLLAGIRSAAGVRWVVADSRLLARAGAHGW